MITTMVMKQTKHSDNKNSNYTLSSKRVCFRA